MLSILKYQLAGIIIIISTLKIFESKAPMRGMLRLGIPGLISLYIADWQNRIFRILFLLVLCGPLVLYLDYDILKFPLATCLFVFYTVTFIDLSEIYGGRSHLWARHLPILKWFINRFNLKLIKTAELNPKETFVFGLHPHGILPFAGMAALNNEFEDGFSKHFPDVNVRFLAASLCFYIPFYRDALLALGIVDASRYSANRVLKKGFSLAVVPGGATEALYSSPKKDVLYLKNRIGFVQLALENGCSLVPIFTFNENNAYDQFGAQFKFVDSFKKQFQKLTGFSFPLVKNIVPKKCNVTCVVGKPIKLPKIENPTKEQAQKYLDIYVKGLEELYEANRKGVNEFSGQGVEVCDSSWLFVEWAWHELIQWLQFTNVLVDGGERAVIFDRYKGVKPNSIGEGMHFLVPWLQKSIIFDIRTKPRSIPTTTGTKDMQTVSLTLRVLYHPDVAKLPSIYSKLGVDYDERVLPSIGNEVLKAVVAQFDAGELITQRELVSQRIREELVKRANEFSIVLEDVSITHLTFGKEFTNAVEQKQVAQQEAERMKFVVEKAEQEKTAAVIRAEGESQAALMISKAMMKSGPGFVELRRIEAAKEIAATLSASRNVTYLPGNQNMLLNIPA